jgi:hypothetical protein
VSAFTRATARQSSLSAPLRAKTGGEGGIRTPEPLARLTVFRVIPLCGIRDHVFCPRRRDKITWQDRRIRHQQFASPAIDVPSRTLDIAHAFPQHPDQGALPEEHAPKDATSSWNALGLHCAQRGVHQDLRNSRYSVGLDLDPTVEDVHVIHNAEIGGGRGIRTPESLARLTVFKTAAFDHSAIPPKN